MYYRIIYIKFFGEIMETIILPLALLTYMATVIAYARKVESKRA
jgi:hypothetical protein